MRLVLGLVAFLLAVTAALGQEAQQQSSCLAMAGEFPGIAQAAAEFGLGEQLYKSGHQTEAIPHFKEAQRLNPKSWNYKRQAWALSDAKRDYGTSFKEEVDKIGGSKVYYPPPELPGEKKPE